MTASPRRFAILDRDGTITEERHYLSDPAEVKLIGGVGRALGGLADLGLGLIIITNQSGVGRGFFDSDRLELIHCRLNDLLKNESVKLDGIYVCPHAPEDNCPCRKPQLGLMERASREYNFDPSQSFVIGDKAIDIEFGRAAGATTILVRTGYGAKVERNKEAASHYVADDLLQAADLIRKIIKSGVSFQR